MKDDIIWEGKNWILAHNKYPYVDNGRHIFIFPREHKVSSSELSPEEFTELNDVHARVKEFFGEENYFSFTRETLSHSRSVEHYHIHFLAGIIQGKYLRKMLENQGFPIKEEKLEMKVCN
jgi:diadenosine tetraphosphate (Ap4A) HIT family hydrolase